MVLDPRDLLKSRIASAGAPPASAEPLSVPLGGTKAERLQRLQIGGFGILAMVLLIGLADIVITRAQETEANAVPEAAPTAVASETSAPSDPLADAGVVPDVPAEPTPAATGPAVNQTGDVPPPTKAPNAPLQ